LLDRQKANSKQQITADETIPGKLQGVMDGQPEPLSVSMCAHITFMGPLYLQWDFENQSPTCPSLNSIRRATKSIHSS